MKLNQNSLHSKLYEFTYESNLPINLCPYFWKLAFAFIVFIPNFILKLPSIVINLFKKDYIREEEKSFGFVCYFILFAIFIIAKSQFDLIKSIFGCYHYDSILANFGWMIDIFVLTLVLYYFIKDKLENKSIDVSDNIIVEFAKAKYGQYCPKINWN